MSQPRDTKVSTLVQQGVARIRATNGEVVGTGFALSKRHVMTCAHVINEALAQRWDAPECPKGVKGVAIEFPFSGSSQRLTAARVIEWYPPLNAPRADIAVLELSTDANVQPLRPSRDPVVPGQPFWTVGFPVGQDGGMDAKGQLGIPVEHGRLIAHGDGLPGFFIEGGYSGAPILDGYSATLLGMVALAVREKEKRTAFILPISDLEYAWPSLARPYQGLAAFRETDARFFKGRDRYVHELSDKLNKLSLVAVVGPSGSGKSSLVRAGLLPLLRSQEDWRAVVFRPGVPSTNPFVNLVLALDDQRPRRPLLDVLAQETQSAQTLAASLLENSEQLAVLLERLTQSDKRPVLLIGDQFEELFTAVTDPHEHDFDQSVRAKFVRSLAAALRAVPHCKCVLTIRADYMGQALKTPDLAKLLKDADVKLGPMNPGELREAITQPAETLGVHVNDDLISELLSAVGSVPDALPLLEFALTEFWVQQRARRIGRSTVSATTVVPGGILQDPLIRHADRVYEEMVREFGETAFRNVMVGLVWIADPDSGGQDTRRVRRRTKFLPAEWQIVEQLASEQREARLITMREDEGDREATAEIAHEVLIRQWPRLQGWLNEDRAFRLWLQTTERDANAWRKGGESDILYRGGRLQEALRWERERGASGLRSVTDFIRAAETQESEEWEKLQKEQLVQARALEIAQRKTVLAQRKTVQRTTAGLILAIGFALLAMWQWNDARTNQRLAEMGEREAFLQAQFKAVSLIDVTNRLTLRNAAVWQAQARQAERDILSQRPEGAKADEDEVTKNNERRLRDAIEKRDSFLRIIEREKDRRYGIFEKINEENGRRWKDDISNSEREEIVENVVRFLSSPPPASDLQTTLRVALYAVAAIPEDNQRLSNVLRTAIERHGQLNFFTPPAALQAWGIAFDPKSKNELRAAVGDDNGVVWLWNPLDPPVSANPKSYTAAPGVVNGLAFSADGNWLAAAYREKGSVVWDLETRTPLCVLGRSDDGRGAFGVAFHGTTLAVAANDHAVHFWHVSEQECSKGHVFNLSDVVYGVAFDSAGERVAAAGGDGTVTIWNIAAPDVPYRKFSTRDNSPAFAVAFSPDGKTLAATAADGRGYLWNIDKPDQNPIVLPPRGGTVGQVAFSPDGQWLVATARADGTAVVTNVDTRDEQYLGGGGEGLFGVAFSPDSRYLLTGDLNGVVGLWSMVPHDIVLNRRDTLIEVGLQRVSDMTLGDNECRILRDMRIPIFRQADEDSVICQVPFLWQKPRPSASSERDQRREK